MQVRVAIPNAITLGGALAAMLSLVWAPVHPYWACDAIIAAALCDMLDGRVARMLDARSELGRHLDSLVDIVAFGVAPAYLAYAWRLHELGKVGEVPLGIIPVFVFVAASALRLARFGTQEDTSGATFRGIPAPVSALLVTTLVMSEIELGVWWMESPTVMVGMVAIASLLMLSPLDFPSFKSFRSPILATLYFGSMVGGLTMLFLGLPGGSVLLGFMVCYLVIGIATIVGKRASPQ